MPRGIKGTSAKTVAEKTIEKNPAEAEVSFSEQVPEATLFDVVEEKKVEQPVAQTFTFEQVQEMISKAVSNAVQEVEKKHAEEEKTQIVRMSTSKERVTFLFLAPVADYNVTSFGDNGIYGKITGPIGTFFVPKDELSRVLTEGVRWMLDERWLIPMDGLTEEEMDALNCNYTPGEVLTREQFRNVLKMGDEEIKDVFKGLCPQHKIIVAQKFLDAWNAKDERVREELVKQLNELSKKPGEKKPGLFAKIIREMQAGTEL